MSDAGTNQAADDHARLSEGLRSAFAEVAAADIDAEQKGRWQRRLIAVTNMSKHDVSRAALQLDKFHGEWNAAKKTSNNETDR